MYREDGKVILVPEKDLPVELPKDVNFSKPGTGIYHYYCCGVDLTNNTDAQKTLNFYFSKPWGYATLQ
jgi:hypothetical protein